MYRTSVLVLAVMLAAVTVVSAQPSLGKPFEIKVGESVAVGPQGLVLGFDAVPLDSRCPLGVFCIWEGDAVAQMWTNLPDEARMDFQLHTHRGFRWQIEYKDYEISLISLAPYPVIDVTTPPADFVVTVLVEGGPAPAENSTWGRIKALY